MQRSSLDDLRALVAVGRNEVLRKQRQIWVFPNLSATQKRSAEEKDRD
jgi:hypothetical protein